MEKNNTGLVVLITILVMAVLGLSGFIVYDKVINKDDKVTTGEDNKVEENNAKEKLTEVSIYDEVITSLRYPMNTFSIGEIKHWDYKNITIDDLTRKDMMFAAAYNVEPIKEEINQMVVEIYSATTIENNFKSIFGPDTKYTNESIGTQECGKISEYNEKDSTYIAYSGCGGDSLSYIDRISKTYKAEKNSDYIYVYQYVQSISVEPDVDNQDDPDKANVYLLDHNDEHTTNIDYKNYKSIINGMIDNGEVDTYKWTFKKQSDGNYYFYSGEWQ